MGHKKTLSLDEVNFLESWQFEPSEEELDTGSPKNRRESKPALRSSASLPSTGVFSIDDSLRTQARPSTTQSLSRPRPQPVQPRCQSDGVLPRRVEPQSAGLGHKPDATKK